ncbi:hypothetical protein BB561_003404 [Smittium simulii]|uniref:Letm1 RBD domain-containing protein n=1 Tax=Smittium simulii TaxID=133385 RepID=A0A2T9YLL6_9FUNG|nr:hypothetical protein BB561_003404 [Smittium simulii]
MLRLSPIPNAYRATNKLYSLYCYLLTDITFLYYSLSTDIPIAPLVISFNQKPIALCAQKSKFLYSQNSFTTICNNSLLKSFAVCNNKSIFTFHSFNSAYYSTLNQNKKTEPSSSAEPINTQTPAKHTEKKLTLWEKVKHEANHYWDGTKLFGKEIKISTKLFIKMLSGTSLTRREHLPFSLFVIIPFAELLLPFALKIYPNLLPSTYEDKKMAESKKLKFQKTRQEVSNYLRVTIKESLENKKQRILNAEDGTTAKNLDFFKQLDASLTNIRASGGKVTQDEILKLAGIFKDDLTLDNLTRPQLILVCRYLDISSYGTDNYIKYNINKRLKYIRADDHIIKSEGLDTLTVNELRSACIARGIKTVGESPAKMKEGLQLWIQLHLELETPTIFLILSRILSAGDQTAKPSIDILQATLSSLPESLVNEATLAMAEEKGTATNKHRLEVLEEQEELIEDESEQEEKHIKSKETSPDSSSSEQTITPDTQSESNTPVDSPTSADLQKQDSSKKPTFK